jgi:hypothetical protein
MIRRRSQCSFNVPLPFKMTKINNKLLRRGSKLIQRSGDPILNGISIEFETSKKILKSPLKYFETILYFGPIPLDERSRVWVCGRSLAGIASSHRAGRLDVCLLCVFFDTYKSLRRAYHSSRGALPSCVSECNREISVMRKPWPARSFCTTKER